MQFILTPDWETGAQAFSQRLNSELNAQKKVLWLTSGGSNVYASVLVMQSVPEAFSHNLSVMPGDERYGEPGHDNSNFEALKRAGFERKNASLWSVLQNGLNFEDTVAAYELQLQAALSEHDIAIAQYGIGEDGHICGILPNSPAAEDVHSLICGYKTEQYDRLTMTFAAIRKLNAAYVLAYGASKRKPLESLKHTALPLKEQPSQILKELKQAYVYNDQVGGDENA